MRPRLTRFASFGRSPDVIGSWRFTPVRGDKVEISLEGSSISNIRSEGIIGDVFKGSSIIEDFFDGEEVVSLSLGGGRFLSKAMRWKVDNSRVVFEAICESLLMSTSTWLKMASWAFKAFSETLESNSVGEHGISLIVESSRVADLKLASEKLY